MKRKQDSSDAPSRKSKKESISSKDMATTFTRTRFFATYRRQQNFSFPPDSIIYYITKNPSSTKAYQKLIQSCKHFFIQNPILVVYKLSWKYNKANELQTRFNDQWIENFNKIASKIWITDILEVENDEHDHFSTTFVPTIYQCDAKELSIWNQTITYNDFVFLSSKSTNTILSLSTVKCGEDAIVALETVFEVMREVKQFRYLIPENDSNIITSKTAQELVKIPHFSNLQEFCIYGVTEKFDIDSFFAYIKKNKKTTFTFYFNNHISDNYKAHLQAIVNEIIESDNLDYLPPYISFPGIDESSGIKLNELFDQAKKRFT